MFFDLGSVAAGQDFVDAIEDAVAACKVLLALIGPSWTDARFADGRRRLLDPADIVRIEIATAMRRNVTVLPILLGGAHPPDAHELPDELCPLRAATLSSSPTSAGTTIAIDCSTDLPRSRAEAPSRR